MQFALITETGNIEMEFSDMETAVSEAKKLAELSNEKIEVWEKKCEVVNQTTIKEA